MPVRHFLRRDYLHILFYIKFLVFVSLVSQISSYSSSEYPCPFTSASIFCPFLQYGQSCLLYV